MSICITRKTRERKRNRDWTKCKGKEKRGREKRGRETRTFDGERHLLNVFLHHLMLFRVLKSFNEDQFDHSTGHLTSLAQFPVCPRCPRCLPRASPLQRCRIEMSPRRRRFYSHRKTKYEREILNFLFKLLLHPDS